MLCRPACAACCIAPSISTPIPACGDGAARAKPAGEACWQLDEALRCRLFGQAGRPAVCGSLAPSPSMCGRSRGHALRRLERLERATRP